MATYLKKYHPGTIFVQLPVEEHDASLLHTLDYQLEKLRAGIEKAKADYKIDKFHLVCHSQGLYSVFYCLYFLLGKQLH